MPKQPKVGETTHGQSRSRTYQSWTHMLQRCENPKYKDYPEYGARGITVCPAWSPRQGGSFDNFYQDLGDRPEGMTLDRVDVNGNYESTNCCWATLSEQQQNKRSNSKQQTITVNELNAAEAQSKRDADTRELDPQRDSVTGRWVKGHPATPGGGRPKRGERLLHYVDRLVEHPRNKVAVAEAHLARMVRTDAVGARAFADHRDTFYGLPKQTLVLEQADNPFFALLASMQGVPLERPATLELPAPADNP